MAGPSEHPGAVVVVGCSWGGLGAVSRLLEGIPSDLPAAVVVIQHRMHAPSELARLLGQHTRWPVSEAEDKETIRAGQVYLAPPGYHLLVDGDRFALSTEAPVGGSRPSIDVAFESVAESLGPRAIGVVLTGANDDGAAGLAEIVRRGGVAVVQDPATAEKRAMPQAALTAAPSAIVVPLDALGATVAGLVADREVDA
jgi:two-component system chemotaxis response regulator CheB